MTEWAAKSYADVSALQQWVAEESLAAVTLAGAERVLDIGCGDGKITAALAARLAGGSVVGVDPSSNMIGFAQTHFPPDQNRNLSFAVGDVRTLTYRDEFDLVVSFNALHWVVDQAAALRTIRAALKPGGRAVLQFVPAGNRQCLEDVIEEARQAPRWGRWFVDYHKPFVHPEPAAYRLLAESCGLRTERLDVQPKQWDFKSRDGFRRFAEATFVEWTRMIPAEERPAFIDDVLDRYGRVEAIPPEQAHTFFFDQMRVELRR